MLGEELSKEEIKDWINLLYETLKDEYIFIGGYYFKLSQLDDFLIIQNRLEKKNLIQIINPKENSSQNRPQTDLREEINVSETIKIKTKNKFFEDKEFPVMVEEFCFIVNDLQQAKDDIEFFKDYLIEELENTKEDTAEFMAFVSDYLLDLRQRFSNDPELKGYKF